MHFNGAPGGTFYINEYKQVRVPAGDWDDYYNADEHHEPLVFEFEGKTLSGQAMDLDGQPLQVGDSWVGPHPGIPYVLKAGSKDISYRYMLRPGVEKEVKLSKCIGVEQARTVAGSISRIKGYGGGRFYVNEFGNIFTPKMGEYGIEYIYLGRIDYANWFPKPEIGAEEMAATDNKGSEDEEVDE